MGSLGLEGVECSSTGFLPLGRWKKGRKGGVEGREKPGEREGKKGGKRRGQRKYTLVRGGSRARDSHPRVLLLPWTGKPFR